MPDDTATPEHPIFPPHYTGIRRADLARLETLLRAAKNRCECTDPSGAIPLIAEAREIVVRAGGGT